MYLDFLLVILAAICNAVMDTVNHHFSVSVFNRIKKPKWRLWFNSDMSWKNKYVDRDPKKGLIKWTILGIKFNKPVQLSDAWHFFKMFMIFFICLIPALHLYMLSPMLIFISLNPVLNIIIYWIILGTLWNITFSMFYNKILKK